jgi:hypothetical protein
LVYWIVPDTAVSVPRLGIDDRFLGLSSGSGQIGVRIHRPMKIIMS